MSKEAKAEMITQSTILDMGWTKSMIVKLLPEPILKPKRKNVIVRLEMLDLTMHFDGNNISKRKRKLPFSKWR